MSSNIERVAFHDMHNEFNRILSALDFEPNKADQCARVFAENSLDGVYSHGVLRFPRFVSYIKKGYVDADAEPSKIFSLGALEQWIGNLGPGPLNAIFAADRSMRLADDFGLGLVALSNTNHWMRGGAFGWHAAKAGYGFMAWTNTEPNMPGWGASESRIGNNPLVVAMPFGDEAIVLDMAMTQFAYGKLEDYRLQEKTLPVPGGFDVNGAVTDNPAAILETMLGLPIGYWKGAGLSLLLDLVASSLSGGDDTRRIGERDDEYGVSQVFLAYNLKGLPNRDQIQDNLKSAIEYYKSSATISENQEILYPGERVLKTRAENIKRGIPVQKEVWESIQHL